MYGDQMSPWGYSLLQEDFLFHVALQKKIYLYFVKEQYDPASEAITKVQELQSRVEERVVNAVLGFPEIKAEDQVCQPLLLGVVHHI